MERFDAVPRLGTLASPAMGRRPPAAVAKAPGPLDAGASLPGDEWHFGGDRYTGSNAQTPRKVVWLAKGTPEEASRALCGRDQAPETEEKGRLTI